MFERMETMAASHDFSARAMIRGLFSDLEAECVVERRQYEDAGVAAPAQKRNKWATYTDRERVRGFIADSEAFFHSHSELGAVDLSASQQRFLVALQHFISEDTNDFYLPESRRKHSDAFEGIQTDAVNSQLVKDAHRSEFVVDGRVFSVRSMLSEDQSDEERQDAILAFQLELVLALEDFLLAFASRRGLSPLGTRRMVQAVTTQMSQAGLANVMKGSQASRYFVGGQGLEQKTAFSVTYMADSALGESLRLKLLHRKTGFTQFYMREAAPTSPGAGDLPLRACAPTSCLHHQAVVRFTPGPVVGGCERIACSVLNALDQAQIDPP